MKSLFVALCLFLGTGCTRSVLPSQRTVLKQNPAALRALVLTHVPLGTRLPEVEQVFQEKFRREVLVMQSVPEGPAGQRRFAVPVVKGDVCLVSVLASAWTGLGQARVMSAYLLLDASGRLKDVAVHQFYDSM